MNRQELIRKLTLVKPALATSDLVAELTCFSFNGKTLLAYKEKIAISVPYKSEFVGALPGSILYALLSSSRAKEVEFIEDAEGKDVVIKAGAAKIKLAKLDEYEDKTGFVMPKKSKESMPEVEKILSAVEHCLRSVGDDPSNPDKMGITLIPEGDKVSLFSTDSTTISHSSVKMPKGTIKGRVILSKDFCEQMVSLGKDELQSAKEAKAEPLMHLAISDVAMFSTSEATLFGTLLASDKPLEFREIFDHHFPSGREKKLLPVPTKLAGVLERASIILDDGSGDSKTDAVISGEKLVLHSQSKRGEVTEAVQFEKHADVKIKFDPKVVKKACDSFDSILLDKTCIVMTNKGSSDVYLIAAS